MLLNTEELGTNELKVLSKQLQILFRQQNMLLIYTSLFFMVALKCPQLQLSVIPENLLCKYHRNMLDSSSRFCLYNCSLRATSVFLVDLNLHAWAQIKKKSKQRFVQKKTKKSTQSVWWIYVYLLRKEKLNNVVYYVTLSCLQRLKNWFFFQFWSKFRKLLAVYLYLKINSKRL